jgi:ElaB/YqjD/DUF883 family membrane-anchored ribosome-binding protein
VDTLERRIAGAVDSTTEMVRDTAGAIRQTVTGAANEARGVYRGASESVKHAFDVRQHVRDYPWACVGAATFAGFLSGFFAPDARRAVANHLSSPGSGSMGAHGIFGQLTDMLKRELRSLGEAAILSATASLRDDVQSIAADFHPLRSAMRAHHNGHHAEPVG